MARPRAEQNGLLLGHNVLTPIAAQPSSAGPDSPMQAGAAAPATPEVAPSKELHSFDANPLQSLNQIAHVPSPTMELFRQLEESHVEDVVVGGDGPEDGAGEKSCLEF